MRTEDPMRSRRFTTVRGSGLRAGRAGERLRHSLRLGVRRVWARYWQRRAERALIQLRALDDATLAAIGVGRSEIGWLVDRAAALVRGNGARCEGRGAAGLLARPLCCEPWPWA